MRHAWTAALYTIVFFFIPAPSISFRSASDFFHCPASEHAEIAAP